MTSQNTTDETTILNLAEKLHRCAMGCAFVASLLFLPAAHAGEHSDASIERMTDTIVGMLDFGGQMDKSAAKAPLWPVESASDKFASGEIACLRDQLSTPGYRRTKRADVAAYAAANPERFERDVEYLASVAPVFVAIRERKPEGDSGVRSGTTRENDDFEALMSKVSADQMLAFVGFIEDEEHAPLRKLVGFSEKGLSQSGGTPFDAGVSAGERNAERLMLKAMEACSIPFSKLFSRFDLVAPPGDRISLRE
ncbi:MAG: hypothetical protein IT473_02915 [Lysobacter sp.]|nr:hypothetical protein [Lysobacter sp.]